MDKIEQLTALEAALDRAHITTTAADNNVVDLPSSSPPTAAQPKLDILLRVQATTFSLDPATIHAFQSDFLNTLIDPDTHFRKPEDGVYTVDASAEHFSALLHMIRYGSLPCNMIVDAHNQEVLLQEAVFWGMDAMKVQEKIQQAKSTWKSSREVLQDAMKLSLEIEKSKMHHNFRANDGHGGIYCLHCGNRDMDDRWYSSSSKSLLLLRSSHKRYADCKNCRRTVNYKPNLGWCHKCRLCIQCQAGMECRADDPMTASSWNRPPKKSTQQLRDELQNFTDSVAF